ncbi:MAG: hypothetical protein KGZ92_06245 [Firmicutes bacterium]|nr:hypothetical protein [Dethiobacter sp.]MBS3888885.1 hypothetical protein [Bacillota bacterium]
MSKWNILESIVYIVMSIIAILFFEGRFLSNVIILALAIIGLALKLFVLKSSVK